MDTTYCVNDILLPECKRLDCVEELILEVVEDDELVPAVQGSAVPLGHHV